MTQCETRSSIRAPPTLVPSVSEGSIAPATAWNTIPKAMVPAATAAKRHHGRSTTARPIARAE
jgi:hypothetical protein